MALEDVGRIRSAKLERVEAPATIQRDGGRRRVVVQANVRDRDLGSFVADAKAAIAAKAIPACNIVCITGDEMKSAIAGYLAALSEADPASVGGALPDDSFYLAG